MAETVFFTSDTHFGHKNITWLGRGRPFDDADAMTEGLVERWNERVHKGDRIYHLGDFSFMNKDRTQEVIHRLNGNIHVIRGNHDSGLDRFADQFASYQSYKEIKMGEQRLVLFHFPILSWHKAHQGSWHLHGHCHGNLPEDPNIPRIDVGVDCTNYAPISYEEVSELLTGRTWIPVDHHDAE